MAGIDAGLDQGIDAAPDQAGAFFSGSVTPTNPLYDAIEIQLRDALGIPSEEDGGFPSSYFTVKIQNAIRHIVGLNPSLSDGIGGVNLTGDALRYFEEAAGLWAAIRYANSPQGRASLTGLIEVETEPVKRRFETGSVGDLTSYLWGLYYEALRLIPGVVVSALGSVSRIARSGATARVGDRQPRSIIEAAYGAGCGDDYDCVGNNGAQDCDDRLGYGILR